MNFKPDIDFTALIETRVLTRDQVTALFGRPPTSGDLNWLRKSFRSKHPDSGSLVRTSKDGRAWLMDQAHARSYHRGRLVGAITAVDTAIETFTRTPVDRLSEPEKRAHRVESDQLAAFKNAQNPLRKALPGTRER